MGQTLAGAAKQSCAPSISGSLAAEAAIEIVLLDAKVHRDVNALVQEGMQGEHQRCPHRWLLGAVLPLRDGSILFRGFCASEAELQAVDGNSCRSLRLHSRSRA